MLINQNLDRKASPARVVRPSASKEDPFYILATSPQPEQSTHGTKHGDTCAVFNRYGDIDLEGLGEKGIYHEGTRHLSYFVLLLEQVHPLFLSANVKEDNDLLTIDLTNPDIRREGNLV